MTKTEQIRQLYIQIMNRAWDLNENDDYTGKGLDPEVDTLMDVLSLAEMELDIFSKLRRLEEFVDGSA